MTVPHAPPAARGRDRRLPPSAACARRGLRVSAARRLVLEALFAAERPVTAEEIAAGLDGRLPASDLASVYRNLETLEELGLVRHVHLGHGPGLYALAGRQRARVRASATRAARRARVDAGAAGRRARRDRARRRLRRPLLALPDRRHLPGVPRRAQRRAPPCTSLTASCRTEVARDGRRAGGRRRRLRPAARRRDARRAPRAAARRDRRVRVRRADAQLPGRRRHQRPLPRRGAGGDPARARGSPAW